VEHNGRCFSADITAINFLPLHFTSYDTAQLQRHLECKCMANASPCIARAVCISHISLGPFLQRHAQTGQSAVLFIYFRFFSVALGSAIRWRMSYYGVPGSGAG
jgi:hypothetical protein